MFLVKNGIAMIALIIEGQGAWRPFDPSLARDEEGRIWVNTGHHPAYHGKFINKTIPPKDKSDGLHQSSAVFPGDGTLRYIWTGSVETERLSDTIGETAYFGMGGSHHSADVISVMTQMKMPPSQILKELRLQVGVRYPRLHFIKTVFEKSTPLSDLIIGECAGGDFAAADSFMGFTAYDPDTHWDKYREELLAL